jgi:hypothetical protein
MPTFVKLVKDEDGNVKVNDDGKPLYLNDKDEEVPVDVPVMYQKILDLGQENKGHREKYEELSKKFAVFDEVEDIEAWHAEALKAIETVENFNEKDWLKADKVENMKAQMRQAHDAELNKIKEQFEENIGKLTASLGKKEEQIRKLVVSNKFSSSSMFSGTKPKTTMSSDVAEAFFGHHFKVEEDDKTGDPVVRAYNNGNVILSASPERIGEIADFDEAMEILFDQYPKKDMYIRSSGRGSGAGGGGGDEDETGLDNISQLQKKYSEAKEAGNTALMISIKNRIHELRNKETGGRV